MCAPFILALFTRYSSTAGAVELYPCMVRFSSIIIKVFSKASAVLRSLYNCCARAQQHLFSRPHHTLVHPPASPSASALFSIPCCVSRVLRLHTTQRAAQLDRRSTQRQRALPLSCTHSCHRHAERVKKMLLHHLLVPARQLRCSAIVMHSTCSTRMALEV
jgi:hypothetical protein